MTETFPRRTVTIDDVSEPGSWAAALADLARVKVIFQQRAICAAMGLDPAEVIQPAPNIPPSNKPTNQHGKTS